MWDLNRDDRSDADITVGVDHYSVQRAYGVASLALVTFAALWPTGRLFMGVASDPGKFQPTWSALCISWGVAVIALSIRTGPAKARPQP